MARREQSLFGLPPVAVQHGSDTDLQLASYPPGRELGRPEQKVVDELRIDRLVMEAQRVRTNFAISQYAEIQRHASEIFDVTVGEIWAIKEQERSREHQAYINEFTTRQLQLFGRQMLGTIEVGCTNIAYETHRPLYPEPDPPEPRSLWKRVFG